MGGDEFMGSFVCYLKDLVIFSGGDESTGLGKLVSWHFIHLRGYRWRSARRFLWRGDGDSSNSVVSVSRRDRKGPG